MVCDRYKLGEDPAKIPSGAQKVTVLAAIVVLKTLCLSLIWGQVMIDKSPREMHREALNACCGCCLLLSYLDDCCCCFR